MKKIRQWLYDLMNIKIFVVFVCTMIIFYFSYSIMKNIYNSDMYFIIATGREIIKNGIIHTNPWTIDSNIGIVVQQWLYAVILATVNDLGFIWLFIFFASELSILILLLYQFFSIHNISLGLKWICIVFTILFSQRYLFSLRPEIVTLILLLGECIALEKYRETSKYRWLIWLPILMLIEINMHASMWPIHFAILLAYMVPSFYMPGVIKNDIHKAWKPITIIVLLMLGAMFINLYGIDGILYIIKSFSSSTFDYVAIDEVLAPSILSFCGLSIIAGFIFLYIARRLNCLSSVTTNMTFGFLFLACLSIRHNMFFLFVLSFLLRDICVCLTVSNFQIDWKKDVKNYLFPFLIFGNVFMLILFLSVSLNTFSVRGESVSRDVSDMCDYIENHADDTTRIFTGFNCGAYFEYRGFSNIYIDARPEIYTSEFTGGKNLLRDYERYALYGYSTVIETVQDEYSVTQDEMDDWFYSYDFDYVMVAAKIETNLAQYMKTNNDYHVIQCSENNAYVLYEKKLV